jgi:hypothetical protein
MPKRGYSTFSAFAPGAGARSNYKKLKKGEMKSYRSYRNLKYGRNALNRRGVASRETGYVDLGNPGFAFDTTGTIALIATVAQGASVNQRVGKKIMLKGLQCRGNAFNNTAATYNDCAVIIVYDKRPTGSLPLITDVLVSASADAMNNDANSGRFKILKRHDFTLIGNTTTPACGQEVEDASWYLPLKGLPCTFKAAGTGAIGDIEEGALYVITVGIRAASATLAATGDLNFRTRFVDI